MKRLVPFFRPDIRESELQEVTDTLRSGWLTTGPRAERFETLFAAHVGAQHAVALNSCTAALHLAIEALDLRPGQGVLVPTMTFAATAEVLRYRGAVPILVDCDSVFLNLDLGSAKERLNQLRAGELGAPFEPRMPVKGMMPVHVGGVLGNLDSLRTFANHHSLWIVEDAAHAFPAAWRPGPARPWKRCGEDTAEITCFSFYANKTITTGEGGMAVTHDPDLAARMRLMSLHGLSDMAWARYSSEGSWDYQITAPGFKYNLTDIAAAIGIHQVARAEEMRARREALALSFCHELKEVEEIELPPVPTDRIPSWHLFPIRLNLQKLSIDRAEVIEELRHLGVSSSVHWRPLHLHPYYRNTFGWQPDQFPVATREWLRLVSLPIYPTMTNDERRHVVDSVMDICRRFSKSRGPRPAHVGRQLVTRSGEAV